MLKIAPISGGCTPNPEQITFLKACLFPAPQAVAAWQEWQNGRTLDVIDEALFRQMPLLYRNLHQAGYDGKEMPLLKGVARRSWYCNQMLSRAVAQLCEAYAAAGVRPLLLKGLALSRLYYPDPFVRHMSDCDLLVRPEQVGDAIKAMLRLGWRPSLPLPDNFIENMHGATFENPAELCVDLHWRLIEDRPVQNDDTQWARAQSIAIEGIEIGTLSATDHLLHVCLHGYRWNPLHPMRWVADAWHILQHDRASIDWNILIAEAHRRKMTLRLRKALGFLRQKFGAPVPLWAMLRLYAFIPRYDEVRAFKAATQHAA
ncbi:MAG: hypothetical protein GC131_00520 [Alphaproteobacteria bacterium]|nr:hypothetical protein [Alphaproteobacteria bacterium]